ncbi:MAG: c-type cytochrome [Ferruginibacter sp.]
MRFNYLFVLMLVFGVYACSDPVTNLPERLLTTDSLQKQNYSININADTLLRTAGGAWLKINKGTFSAENGTAAIEIREAYSVEQIVKAGLLTASNGIPLSSGGMIYINAAAGQKITINKPFKVAVPSAFLDKGMQLYKGEKDKDGNINWNNPAAVDSNRQMRDIQKGEILFRQKCASCHGIGKEGSGPDLANLYRRFGPPWQHEGEGDSGYWSYYRHNFKKVHYYHSDITTVYRGKVIAKRDTLQHYIENYECNLISLFGNNAVDLYTEWEKNQDDWNKIYNYIENESYRGNLPNPRHAYLKASADSCRLYELSKKLKAELLDKKQREIELQEALVEANGPLVDKRTDPAGQSGNSSMPPPDFSQRVTPGQYDAVYYQFTIESFGWFNIDMLLKDKEGVQQSELFVRIVGAIKEKIKIYLVIPSAKVYGEGGVSDRGGDEYAFFNVNGSLPLPQNSKAFILAVTETEKSIAFGIREFTTQTKQSFELALKESTKQEFNAAIKSMDATSLSITVAESKNAAAIKAADKTIAQLEAEIQKTALLKPRGCDCDCGKMTDSVVAIPETASPANYNK